MAWKLENGEARAKESPNSFEIPDREARRNLVPGMFAKLIFLQKDSAEGMWVEVKDVLGPGRYEGVLANNPTLIQGLEFGTVLRFEAKNVVNIEDRGAIFHPNPTNYSLDGVFDAFEIWRSDQPRPEVTIEEEDIWYYAAPEEVKKRTRGRGPAQGPSSSIFSRPSEGEGPDRPGSASSKDWSPNRPSRFGSRPSSGFNRPRGDEPRYGGEEV